MIRAWRHSGDAGLALSQHELAAPTLAGDQVQIEIEAAAFGRVDLDRALAGGPTPGGAGVGTVIATGDDAGHLAGARVAFGPSIPCGECGVCRRGTTGACPRGQILGRDVDGALASATVTRARWVCRLDDGLELPGPAAALLGREAANAYGLFARVGVGPGEPMAIVGTDATASFLAQIARSRGAKVVCVDAVADDAVARCRDDASQAELGDRPWRVFVTLPCPRSTAIALELLGPGATLALLGPAAGPCPVDVGLLAEREALVVGVAAAHPDLLPEVAAMAVRGDIDLAAAADVVAAGDWGDLERRVETGERDGRVPVALLAAT